MKTESIEEFVAMYNADVKIEGSARVMSQFNPLTVSSAEYQTVPTIKITMTCDEFERMTNILVKEETERYARNVMPMLHEAYSKYQMLLSLLR